MTTTIPFSIEETEDTPEPVGDGAGIFQECDDDGSYGEEVYGGPYGGCPNDFERLINSRLLMFIRGDTIFPELIHMFSTRVGGNMLAVEQIVAGLDLGTAEGDALDRLGGVLQVRRAGMSDSTYRKVLQIQIRLILTTNGSAETILEIARMWVGQPPLSFTESYPAQFRIECFSSYEEAPVLIGLLTRAKVGGVGGTVLISPPVDYFVLDSTEDPIDGAGVLDSAGPGGPVAGAHLTSSIYLI
jgi:hypothetical protein